MIFKWLDTTGVDQLAAEMASELQKRIPPSDLGSAGRKAEAKERKLYESVLRKARDYASAHQLNVYTKARLANEFRWALSEAGYPKDFVERLSYDLAATIASAKATSE